MHNFFSFISQNLFIKFAKVKYEHKRHPIIAIKQHKRLTLLKIPIAKTLPAIEKNEAMSPIIK